MYYPPCFVLFIYLYFALFFCLLNKHYRILLFNMNLGPIQGWNMEPLKNLTCWEEQDKTYLRCFYNFCFMRLGRTRDCILFILVPMLFFFLNTIIFLVFFYHWWNYNSWKSNGNPYFSLYRKLLGLLLYIFTI